MLLLLPTAAHKDKSSTNLLRYNKGPTPWNKTTDDKMTKKKYIFKTVLNYLTDGGHFKSQYLLAWWSYSKF